MQDISQNLMDKAISCGIPGVIVDSHSIDDRIPYMAPDYRKATSNATKHLIEHGHKKIAIIASKTVPNFYKQTLAGFKDTMTSHSIPINPDFYGITAINEKTA